MAMYIVFQLSNSKGRCNKKLSNTLANSVEPVANSRLNKQCSSWKTVKSEMQ